MENNTNNAEAKIKHKRLPDLKMRERFVQGKMKGMMHSEAARYAGYKGKDPSARGYQLSVDPIVVKLWDDARAKEAQKAEAEEQKAEALIRKEEKIKQVVEFDDIDIDLETVKTADWQIVQHALAYKTAKLMNNEKDARASLVEIGKLSGNYKEIKEITTTANITTMSGQDLITLQSLLKVMREQIQISKKEIIEADYVRIES